MIFVFIAIITYSAQNVANKEVGRRYGSLEGATLIQDLELVFWAAVIMLCTGTFSVLTGKYLALSVVFGVVYIVTMFSLITAMTIGSIGDSTIMINLGLFFSSVYGIIRYHDKVTVLTGIGMACMFAVIILSAPSKKEKKENPNKLKWFLLALFCAVCNSGLAIIKRTVAGWNVSAEEGKIEMTNFLFWAFLFSTVGCLILMLFKRPEKSTFGTMFSGKRIIPTVLFGMIGGMGTACGNLFQMVAISKGVSSAVVYPVCAGSLITIAWLISVLYYKEIKPNAKSIISLVLCITGIVLAQV